MSGTRRLLVLVHPGSSCGSADFNLGEAKGREIRAGLAAEFDAWTGDVCVIDGDLSKELRLRRYAGLGLPLARMLDRCRAAGHEVERLHGCAMEAFDHRDAAQELIEEWRLSPETTEVTLTGAWYDPLDRQDAGCVNDVRKVFRDAGFDPAVGPAAAHVAPDYSPEDDMDAIVKLFM